MTGSAICSKCDEEKSLSEFYSRKAKKYKFRLICKECCKGVSRVNHFKTAYGLSPESLQEMRQAQDGKCAICCEPCSRLNVDHSHVTGKVRALLCPQCNAAIGMLKDSVVIAENAANYLRRFV